MDAKSKKLLEERLQYDLTTISSAQQEINMIRAALEAQEWPVCENLDDRIKIAYKIINKTLHLYYEFIRAEIPKADQCKLELRDIRIGFDRKFEWNLILPLESVGGEHHKYLDLTGIVCFPPSKSDKDVELELFIDQLIRDKLLVRLVKTTVNPLGSISL